MSEHRRAHPLDVDLADLVDGTVDETRAAQLEAHLADCLLCRIKRQRLRGAPPAAPADDLLGPAPSFAVPDRRAGAGAPPESGELWLCGSEERLLVVVLRVHGRRALVAPVTFDVDAADDETLVLDAGHSPLETELAIFLSLASEVPHSMLGERIATFSPDALAGVLKGGGAGVRRGPAIAGPSDPRLEVRQYLADRLASMDEQPPDPATASDAPPIRPAQVRSSLVADVRALRGDICTVRPIAEWGDALLAHRAGWEPLVTIDEVGVVVVVFDTPHGLADDADFTAAQSVLTRFNGSALVVLARAVSDLADVFDSSSLNHGIDAPSGRHTPPRPLISGLTPFDAIAKFLDQTTGARMVAPPARGFVGRVDVGDVVRDTATAALADAARQGARFKIAPKRSGYESVGDDGDRFRTALERAFSGGSVAEALIELARERPEDQT